MKITDCTPKKNARTVKRRTVWLVTEFDPEGHEHQVLSYDSQKEAEERFHAPENHDCVVSVAITKIEY